MSDISEKIAKLPRWAQKHIADIQQQRNVAVDALNEYIDTQTPSAIYIDEMERIGEKCGPSVKRRYIQGYRITMNHAGVILDATLMEKYINLRWEDRNHLGNHVVFSPTSFQQAELISRDNMR